MSNSMLYMVIEKFRDQDAAAVYRRLEKSGRLMPDGLEYVDSWAATDLGGCFQIMQCDDVDLLHQWIANWSDLVEFEIVPVTSSADAAQAAQSL